MSFNDVIFLNYLLLHQTVFPTTDKSGENLGMVKTWLHAQSDNSAMDVVAGVTR